MLESTSYPGTTEELVGPLLEEGSGLQAGRDFHLGYSPERIDPGNQTWRFENTPKVVSGIDDASLARGARLLRSARRHDGGGVGYPGGRADQAPREHLPTRQYRSSQRAGHVRRRTGDRHLGGHRRSVDQALRLHALHPRSRCGWSLPARSTRATCRGRCGGAWASRSGSSSWPTTSTSTCPTTWSDASCWPSTGRVGRSRDPESSSRAWPTSATPATPGKPPGR